MAPQTSGANRPDGKRRLARIIGTGGWRTARKAALCAACGRPTFMRDPHGRPHHRLDCAGDPDAA